MIRNQFEVGQEAERREGAQLVLVETKIPIDLTNRTAIGQLGDIFVDEQWLEMHLRILETAKRLGYEDLDEFESQVRQLEEQLANSTRALCQILGIPLERDQDAPRLQDFVILDAQGKELDMEAYTS